MPELRMIKKKPPEEGNFITVKSRDSIDNEEDASEIERTTVIGFYEKEIIATTKQLEKECPRRNRQQHFQKIY